MYRGPSILKSTLRIQVFKLYIRRGLPGQGTSSFVIPIIIKLSLLLLLAMALRAELKFVSMAWGVSLITMFLSTGFPPLLKATGGRLAYDSLSLSLVVLTL